jgi:hypothetical protein
MFLALKEKFQQGDSQSMTSSVNPFITLQRGHWLALCAVKAPKSEYLIQLRCWKTSLIEGVSDLEKVKRAYSSVELYTNETSNLHSLVDKMAVETAEEVMSKGGHH